MNNGKEGGRGWNDEETTPKYTHWQLFVKSNIKCYKPTSA